MLKSEYETALCKSEECLRQSEHTHQTNRAQWELEKDKLLQTIKRSQNDKRLTERIKALEEELKHQKELSHKDLGSLKVQITSIKSEHAAHVAKIDNEHNENIEKLKAIHIRELQITKNAREEEESNANQAKSVISRLEKQIESQQREISRLSKEAKEVRQVWHDGKKEKSELNNLLDGLHKEQEALRTQLESSNISRSQTENKLNQTLAQLEHAQQETNIKHRLVVEKVARNGELEGEIARLEATLKVNKKALYEADLKLSQVEKMKKDNHNLASKKIQDLTLQLDGLQERMKGKTAEFEQLTSDSNKEIKALMEKRKTDEREFNRRIQEMKQNNQTLLKETTSQLNQQFDIERENLVQISNSAVEKERAKSKVKIDALDSELNEMKQKYNLAVSESATQLNELKSVMESQYSEAGDLNGQIEYLRNRERDLEKTKGTLLTSIQTLENELKLRQKKVDELEVVLKNEENVRRLREEKVQREAQVAERTKWEKELVRQLEILRNDLSQRLQKERADAVALVQGEKRDELAAARKGWESSLSRLAEEMSQLKSEHEVAIHGKMGEMQIMQEKHESELEQMKNGFATQLAEHQKSESKNNRDWKMRLVELEEKMIKEKRAEMEQFESNSHKERLELMESQRISIDALRGKLEGNFNRQLQQMEEEHVEAIELLQQRLEEQHQVEIEQEYKRQEEEMLEIENQLEKERKCRKREKEEALLAEQTLQRTSEGLQASLDRANEQNQTQLSENAALCVELGNVKKSHEQGLVERERLLENQWKEAEVEKENALNECIADGLRRRQSMLNDFNKAQDLLKIKITELATQLAESETKFKNRTSLEEDIQLIAQLQRILREKEEQIEKLQDEMKFYQLELINREQNYNTMFSANPQVGLINPLGKSSSRGKTSVALNPTARPARFQDHFVRIDPALLADHLPPHRHLEPISNKKPVKNST